MGDISEISMAGLTEISKFNKSQPSIETEELSRNLCPDDDWPLNVNSEGQRSCPICGRIWR